MAEIIVFRTQTGVAAMAPNLLCGLTVREVAEKNMPLGVPFFIMAETALPTEAPQETWVLDEESGAVLADHDKLKALHGRKAEERRQELLSEA